jgi:hypothetical protein
MSVYDKLAGLLAERREEAWEVGFAELERLIGRKLPASAWKYPAWWSNDPSNNSMTKVWLRAGWRTEQVDVPGQTVVFRRAAAHKDLGEAGFGDRAREFDYAPAALAPEMKMARAPETKMATKEMMMQAAAKQKSAAGEDGKTPFERLYGCLKGTIKIAPGVDLTEPTWGPEEWEAWEEKWDRLLPRKEWRA